MLPMGLDHARDPVGRDVAVVLGYGHDLAARCLVAGMSQLEYRLARQRNPTHGAAQRVELFRVRRRIMRAIDDDELLRLRVPPARQLA